MTHTHQSGRYPVRVLQVIHGMRPGGIETTLMNVYRNIDRDQIQFDFAVRVQEEEFYDKEILALGGRILRLPWYHGKPWSLRYYIPAFRKLLQQQGPFVVVHSHIAFLDGITLLIAKKEGVKTRIAHSHNIAVDAGFSILRELSTPFLRYSIMRNATHLFACSDAAGQWAYGTIDDPRFEVFYNALELSRFRPDSKTKSRLRVELNLPATGTLIGHVGRFDTQKNHEYLIKVFCQYKKNHPDAHLLLIGEGRLQSQIQHLTHSLGIQDSVIFAGARSEIPELMYCMDVFVFPSLFEGLGIVLVEAQAAGLPCVVSANVPSAADMGLGLVTFLELDKGVYEWSEVIDYTINNTRINPVPDWAVRRQKLAQNGYDVETTADTLAKLYLQQVNNI